MTQYHYYVAIETILIDIHSNHVLLSIGEKNIYFPSKFHEYSINSFQVMLEYVKKFGRVLQICCHRNHNVDIHSDKIHSDIGVDHTYVS